MASQILSVDPANPHLFTLQTDLIRNILTHKNLHKRKVAIISIAGPYRKGKSFLLNFFLRYFRSPDWLHTDVQQDLEGFEWVDGAPAVTKGVWLWPEPFIVGDVAIFLMDTQGLFDSTQSDRENTTILALTTMVSTVTIYNVHMDLQTNVLNSLNYSTEYGKSALRPEDFNGAGKLVVLVRDWMYIQSHPWGFVGGGHYIGKWLRDQNAQLGESLRGNFADITCFLMPELEHVAHMIQAPFSGRLDQLDGEFVTRLGQFIPEVVDGVLANAVFQTGPEVFSRFVTCFAALSDAARAL